MLSRRRLLLALGVVAVAVVAFTVWRVWQVQGDLTRAEASVDDPTVAIDTGDKAQRQAAIADFQDAAASAADHTGGLWWSMLTKVPLVGDDAAGVRALSTSLEMVATDGVTPLADSVDGLDNISTDGRIDTDLVASLQLPFSEAAEAFQRNEGEVAGLDSDGYADILRLRFDDYVDRVRSANQALASAETATQVLPDMVGSDGPRDYLLLFQNNAEVRATGGMPGSWAQVHAEDGVLERTLQGTASDFPTTRQLVLPTTDEERAVCGVEQGIYFQNPGFSPDFPRAADFWQAHWDLKFPDVPLDGVLALAPVGMSYLLAGRGPVQVGDLQLTTDNLVQELLNKSYLTLDPLAQDALFQEAAGAIFDAITGDLQPPVDLVSGLSRAAREGRFLVAPFDDEIAKALADSDVRGALSGDDGATPHVDIGINDTTGSKMSYYLRYWADVKAASCESGTQELRGSMTLTQVIAPAEAAALPDSVTGGGNYGTEPGNQLVSVRLYSPYEGTIDDIKVDGRSIEFENMPTLDERAVANLAISLTTRDDVVVTWTMRTGLGQTANGELEMTPSVVAGGKNAAFKSACPP